MDGWPYPDDTIHTRQNLTQAPVLVGGAATAIYTDGALPSGNFDVVANLTSALKEAMLSKGLSKKTDRASFLYRGKLRDGSRLV